MVAVGTVTIYGLENFVRGSLAGLTTLRFYGSPWYKAFIF